MELSLIIVPLATFAGVVALMAGAYTVVQRRQLIRARIERSYQVGAIAEGASPGASVFRDRRLSSFSGLDELLKRSGFAEGMALDLARASLPLRVGEYLIIRVLSAFLLAVIVIGMDFHPLLALAAALIGSYLPKLYVKGCQHRRWRKLDDQLVDLTILLANSLRSGSSFVQGLEMASREMPAPISEDVSQVLAEMGMGGTAEDALANLAKRVKSYDLDLIVTAMLIQRQVGGNLAEILENISSTIRARIRMVREIKSLTAEGRLSAYIVGFLPFFMMAVMSVVNRSYLMDLLTSSSGQAMLVGAVILEIVGFFILRKITSAIEL